jgi:hypothetical protein
MARTCVASRTAMASSALQLAKTIRQLSVRGYSYINRRYIHYVLLVTSRIWNRLKVYKGKGHPVTCRLRHRSGSMVIDLPMLEFMR